MTTLNNTTTPQKPIPIIGVKDVHGMLKKEPAKKDLDLSFNSRIRIFLALAIVVSTCIVYKVTLIQSQEFIEKSETDLSKEYVYFDKVVYPERGSIYDRRGNLLAGNQTTYEVGLDLIDVKNPETIADVMHEQLGLDWQYVYNKASIPYDPVNNVYYRLATSVDVDKYHKIVDIQNAYAYELSDAQTSADHPPSLSGLKFSTYLERNYPEQTLASNVLGFVNFLDPDTGTGHYGIEEEYNDRLAGKPERVRIKLDPSSTMEIPTVPPGESFILTIDREIQSMTEEELDKAVAQYGAKTATAIIMNPETGEILAMAQTPRRNPNTYYEEDERFTTSDPFNRAIAAMYEPGSTFKPITMAGALDNDVVEPETTYYDAGTYYIGGYYLKNWDEAAHGEQTMTGCLQLSLNVCLAWVADEMGEELFYKNIVNFGLDRPTNIDLGGEDWYPVDMPGSGKWYDVDLGTNSYGQGISFTPIQLITALSALANEGKIMQPHVVKASIFRGTVTENPPTVNSMPISKETAETLTEMLATALENETKYAKVPGYRVAGKTGTASIAKENGGGYEKDLTNTSFVGWGPADDPKFIIYIWIEKPATGEWGSVVAAPVFSEIAQKLVILLDIPPDNIRLGTPTPENATNDTLEGN